MTLADSATSCRRERTGSTTLPAARREFRSRRTLPPHFADQQPLYENLIYARADADRTTRSRTTSRTPPSASRPETSNRRSNRAPASPSIRDNAYGVPHVYGDTRADTMFGAGYAGAAGPPVPDGRAAPHRPRGTRLLPRRLQRRQRTPAVGLRALHRSRPGKTDRQAPQLYGAGRSAGSQDLSDYVDGINAYIAAANANPSLMPGEYALLGKPIEPWKATDVIAIGSLIGGIFGKGGGNELDSALTMQAFVETLGNEAGRKAWLGFRSKNDPEAPTTIAKAFPYETRSAFAKSGLALPDRGCVTDAPPASASRRGSSAAQRPQLGPPLARIAPSGRPRVQLGDDLRRSRRTATRSASSARRSATTSRRS